LTTSAPSAAPPAKAQSKLQRVAYAVVGVILFLVGLMRLYFVFFPGLPGCSSDAARSTIIDIYKKKNVEITELSNQRTLTDSSTENTCQADVKTPTQTATLSYRIYWKGKTAEVLITKVDTH